MGKGKRKEGESGNRSWEGLFAAEDQCLVSSIPLWVAHYCNTSSQGIQCLCPPRGSNIHTHPHKGHIHLIQNHKNNFFLKDGVTETPQHNTTKERAGEAEK